MIAFILLFIAQVFAQDTVTLAVMPLEKASASEQYDGLGKALAGMLVTDLSAVEGLALVERDRLQALLAEMELADSGFLDEKTAQKLGSGLGAQFILTGSYSVVAETFVLDARVIEVETGTIKKAASAHGTVADFVTVEKDLVEGLIEGLDVTLTSGLRRQLYTQTPTEDFGAFSKYGEGLQRQDEGDFEAAKAAYEAALGADPEFAEARAALSEVRGLLESYQDVRTSRYNDAYVRMNDAVLSAVPPVGKVGESTPELVDFGIRVTALANMEQDCTRWEEMFAYGEQVGWAPPSPKDFHAVARARVEELGLTRPPHDSGVPQVATSLNVNERVAVVTSLEGLLLGDEWWDWKRGEPTGGMLDSLTRCYPPEEQLAQLDRLAKSMKKAGVDQTQPWERRNNGVTWEDHLDAAWLHVHARRIGASPELTVRSERLLERTKVSDPGDTVQASRESWALQEMEGVVRDAGNTENWKRMRLGISIDAMNTFLGGVATGDPAVLDLSTETCQFMAEKYQGQAENSHARLQEQLAEDDYFAGMTAGQGGTIYGPMSSMGCVKGVPARFRNLDEVVVFIEGAVQRYRENPIKGEYGIDCKPMIEGMKTMTQSLPQIRQYGTMSDPQVADTLLTQYTSAVGLGCYAEF